MSLGVRVRRVRALGAARRRLRKGKGFAVAVEVADAAERHRYEARDGQELLGFAEYQKTPELVVFTHTIVEPAYEGRGVGSALVRAALDDVRGQGLAVLPLCPFVKSWIGRHPDYADLVYSRPSSRAGD